MESKKSERADLEKNRFILFEIGMIVALALVLLAFNWKSHDKTITELYRQKDVNLTEEIIPITEQKAPEPPKVEAPKVFSSIKIVEDEAIIDDDILINAEADQATEIPEYVPVTIEKREEEAIEEEEIFYVVESQPQYPGGDKALYEYLARNLDYPDAAKEAGIQGRVFVAFVVEKDGSISNVRVLRGIGGGCDEEAVRVVQNMPRWTAGKQRGIPVRVHFNLPIKFTLQ